MLQIHRDTKSVQLIYFWLGLIATFAYRIIIVLNFVEPIWVKVAWYVGTIGFIFYFWSRYRAVNQYKTLIKEQHLISAVKKSGLSANQKKALSFIVETLDQTTAQIIYIAVFILSAIALAAGIILDFLI
ncbi:MAG: hypothetical protein ABH826_01210 [Patescibacteria group bacterium]